MSSVRSLAAVLILMLLPVAASADEPVTVRVLTYNIQHGAGMDGKLDLERTAKVIRQARPDLVGLQEVDVLTRRTGNVDQARQLAELTEMHSYFGANIALQGGHYGNALLSKSPNERAQNRHLPNFDGGEQRGLQSMQVRSLDLGEPLTIYNTHFDHRRDDGERLAGVETIRALVKPHPDRLAILIGDLNATPDSAVLKALAEDWKVLGDGQQLTFPANQPRRQIDYILVRPAERFQLVELTVLDEPQASDHRPVLAVLKILPPPE